MISESDFKHEWRRLFSQETMPPDDKHIKDKHIKKARKLIDQLPVESPLRKRFTDELGEIRAKRQEDER